MEMISALLKKALAEGAAKNRTIMCHDLYMVGPNDFTIVLMSQAAGGARVEREATAGRVMASAAWEQS